MTDDLIAWLRAQLDDDERVARAVPEAPWAARPDPIGHPDVISVPRDRDHGRDEVVLAEVWRDGVMEYATRFHPARVLADVDAKRRILAIHHPEKFEGLGGLPQICAGCGYEGICDDPVTEDINDCPILRCLALPYADREGYREEWKP